MSHAIEVDKTLGDIKTCNSTSEQYLMTFPLKTNNTKL